MEPEPTASAAERSGDADDVALMLRVKEGDERAFELLVERHQAAVIGAAYRMLHDLDEAHDIAQRAFLRVWTSAPRYEPQAKFTTWLYTITKNLVFNEARRRSRRVVYSLEAQEAELHMSHPDPKAESPADTALNREMQEALNAAMQRLPERQRMALVLRRFEHLPYEEIAQVLEISVPSVKSLLFRARTQLREDLRAYLGKDADRLGSPAG